MLLEHRCKQGPHSDLGSAFKDRSAGAANVTCVPYLEAAQG